MAFLVHFTSVRHYLFAAYCYRRSSVVCLSVCLSVTTVIPAKTAEPMEITFGLWIPVGPRNHVLCLWQTLKKPVPETGTRKTGNGFRYVWHAILHRFFLVPDSGIGENMFCSVPFSGTGFLSVCHWHEETDSFTIDTCQPHCCLYSLFTRQADEVSVMQRLQYGWNPCWNSQQPFLGFFHIAS